MPEEKYYLTKEGLEKIKKDLERFRKLRLDKIKGGGPGFFRFGEVDPEYLAFQQDVDRLEEKIAEIETVLENYILIKTPPQKEQNKVRLGARVIVEVDDQTDEFFILSTLEANPALGKISDKSPVGKALLGRKIGEKIIINSPVKITYKIKDIKYDK